MTVGRRRLDRRARAALVVLGALVLAAILVPPLAPTDPRAIGNVLALRFLPPLATDPLGHWHLLGTDAFGRDLFTRMMLASRVSLLVGF
ncbi:MAG TPA: ABC transporter permease, partial [Casimicrobiaceae bacterium]|nr:ABC transporter permease [Casimicrobiaceae bacterium]